jgi:hypothetical protein
VILDLAGLHPNAEGRRVKFSGGTAPSSAGRLPGPKELIAGYRILQVTSMDGGRRMGQARAVRGACPDLPRRVRRRGRDIEIRQLVELKRSDASV